MSFTKLDSGIIDSSIWDEPASTRVVWVTLLAKCDENGFVRTSRSALMRSSNISNPDFDTAINCLESPDPESRTKDFDGRRIQKIEGGWIVLNYDKYRSKEQEIRIQTRERVKKFREKLNDVTLPSVTPALPSASASVSSSSSHSSSEEGDVGGDTKKPERTWRNDYDTYHIECEAAFDALYENWNWIAEMRVYYPGCSIQRTLNKMFSQFWGTEAGWKNKKAKRGLVIDWKRTIENNFQKNRVFWGKGEMDTEEVNLKAKGIIE